MTHAQANILLRHACVVNHDSVSKNVDVLIRDGLIADISQNATSPEADLTLDISGKYLYPGLINSHDHLVGEWTPRVGRNRPYINAEEWQKDFLDKENPCHDYVEKRTVMDENLNAIIWLGIYKNVFSGVTLVSDHFHYSDGFPIRDCPIRIVDNFTQCHSLYWGNFWGGDDCASEFKKAQGKMPFVIHIGEGIDEGTKEELTKLHRMGCLDSNTLLIHGISFREKEADLLVQTGASLVWCPDSNMYIIGRTADIPLLLRKGVNIALGTDSSMSGSQSMFEGLRSAKEAYREMTGKSMGDQLLFSLISKNASRGLLVEKEAGRVAPGGWGDVLVMDPVAEDPYRSLADSTAENIYLLVCRGLPVLMDAKIAGQVKKPPLPYTRVKLNGKEMLVAGDPFKPIQEISEILGYKKKFDFLPFDH